MVIVGQQPTLVNGYPSRYNADTPANAYGKLVNSLKWAVDKMHFQANEAAYQLRKTAERMAA